MNLKALAPVAVLAALGAASAASALTITVEPGGNLTAFSYNVDSATRTIDIYETWGVGTSQQIYLRFDDWNYNLSSWTVNKYVTNETGHDWTSFAHELLNAQKYGSVDNDGLSFAQLGVPARPRGSDRFDDVTADELADRDYLFFDNGLVADGDTVWFTYGITARRPDTTRPFYLRQSEFLNVVPEPATWALLIVGFGLVGASLRRRRGTVSVSA